MKLLPVGALLVVVTSWHLHRAAALSPAETHFAIGPVEDDVDAQEELVPKYMLADDRAVFLSNVRDVLELMGYQATDDPSQAHVIWSFSFPFMPSTSNASNLKLKAAEPHMKHLGPSQFVNQIPGFNHLTSKRALSRLSSTLPYLPRTFSLPEDYDAWQQFVATQQGASLEWLQKGHHHRGVAIINDTKAQRFKDQKDPLVVQQLIRPYLIDNRLWDIGVYVAVTSTQPLLVYVYTAGALVRFCSQEYDRNITADTPRSAYVIEGLVNYLPARKVPSLQAFFEDAPHDLEHGTTVGLAAIRGYLDSRGLDSAAWWLDVQAKIVQTLQTLAPTIRKVRDEDYPNKPHNFFTLLRFDFILDEHQKNWLVEVNMSPGLYRSDVPLRKQYLPRQLVYDLLSLKGLAPGGTWHPNTPPELRDASLHPDAVTLGAVSCQDGWCNSEAKCDAQPTCGLCHRCRTQEQDGILSNLVAEHKGARGFMRIHPPHQRLAAYMGAIPGAKWEHEDDTLVRTWVEAKCRQDYRWC